MCGRFIVSYTYDQLVHFLSETFSIFDLNAEDYMPRYNIAPGQQVSSIISDGSKYRLGEFKWGIVPSYSKDENSGYKFINARIETVKSKVSLKKEIFFSSF